MGKPVTAIKEESDHVTLFLGGEAIQSRYLIACAGLQADRVAGMMNIDLDFKIIPFRLYLIFLFPKCMHLAIFS